jgi:hypothetical protein
MRKRAGAVLAVAASLALGAAACGGSSSGPSTGAGGSSPTISAGGSSIGSESLSAGNGFCGDAKGKLADLQATMAQLATITSDPERIKKQLEALQSFVQSAQSDAPSEIQGDVASFATFLKHMNDVYAQNGYDPMKAAPELVPYIQQMQSKLETSSKHVQAWAKANCGT